MDTFLLTSKFEGLPNVVIEAQSQGIPVITTLAGGSGEAIDLDISGFLVEKRNSKDLAKKIIFSLTNTAWRKKACLRATEFSKSRFGFERMIDETVAVYERAGS